MGKSKIEYCKKAFRAGMFAICNRVYGRVLPLKEDQVLFASDVRGEIGGNLQFVRDHLPKGMQARYDFLADRRLPRGVMRSLRLFRDLSTSKYILLEDYFTYISYMKVRPGQQICQLWHGAGAFKKFGFSRAGNTEGIKVHKGYRKYAKAITSADAIRPQYAEAFDIALEKVQATGVPRTDIFFDEDYVAKTRESLYEAYPVLRDKKVILFAPTYRGTSAEDAAYDFSKIDPDQLFDALGEDYVFVFKWHPAAYNNLRREEKAAYELERYGNFFLDLSQERDINDLLLVTDVLITDYSSVIFDYYLTGKPVIYYAYDLEDYAGGRGMYFPFEEYLFGPVVMNQEGLIEAIRKADLCDEKRAAFGRKFMEACDGHATEKTCAWLFEDYIAAHPGSFEAVSQEDGEAAR